MKGVYMIIIIIFVIFFYKSDNFVPQCKYFQHNSDVRVNFETFNYVYNVKKQLLHNINSLLCNLNIKYVISHGNLIEYIRGDTIYHDDDIDLRMDINDFNKWKQYCENRKYIYDTKYNLQFDNRIFNIEKQRWNGIQVRLIRFKNKNLSLKEFSNMDIHCDLVFNYVGNKFWVDYDIDFNKRIPIKFLGVKSYAPNIKEAYKVLKKEYKYFIKPNYDIYKLQSSKVCP